LKADSSGYDVEYAGYVNSTGSGAYTWADTYSGIVILPAGTKFAKMDPQSHYEPEEVTTYHRGKRVTRPTGRMIKASVPSYNISEYYPTVNTGNSNNGVASNVVVVNTEPIPVKLPSGDPLSVTDSKMLAATQEIKNLLSDGLFETSGPYLESLDVSANQMVTKLTQIFAKLSSDPGSIQTLVKQLTNLGLQQYGVIADMASDLTAIKTDTTSSLAVERQMESLLDNISKKEPSTHVTADITGIVTYDREGALVTKPIAAMHNGSDAGESYTLTSAIVQPIAPYNIGSTWYVNYSDAIGTRMPNVVNNGNKNEFCVRE